MPFVFESNVFDKKPTIFSLLVTLALLGGCQSGVPATVASSEQNDLVVFLVRHAEKKSGSDPILTLQGQQRAELLAQMLHNAGIGHVHSSDYRRTRLTAEPVATALGIPVTIYDAGNLQAVADYLKTAGGRHLVVGHSNTTPALVALLGGDPGAAIAEKSEYDRLYIVTLTQRGGVETVLLRYGDP